ncbi:MAG: ABC transporter permease [Sphingomonadales bacterium]|nr:ABC transporter permease [Sphingomonadales bacterium]
MRAFIVGKIKFLLAVLFGLLLFIFSLFMILPSPEQILSGQRSDKATTDAIIRDLGLDQPKWKQLVFYINDLSPVSWYPAGSQRPNQTGGVKVASMESGTLILKAPYLRTSFQNKKPVSGIIAEAFTGTMVLAFSALLFALALGIPLGVLSAIKRGTVFDNSIVALSAAGISLPAFFSAMLIAWLFGYVWKQYTGLEMTGSLWEVDPMGEGRYLAWKNLILPAVALGLRPLAVFIQLTRNTMVDVLYQDYIRTARAKGLTEWKVIWLHAFPNAVNPLVTSIGGWLSSLLAGSFFTEYIFNWKGLGKVAIDALQNSDLPVIMGSVLFTAIIFFFVNLITEMCYIWLDPRLRHG